MSCRVKRSRGYARGKVLIERCGNNEFNLCDFFFVGGDLLGGWAADYVN